MIDNGEGLGKTLSSSNYKNVLINDINVRMKWCNTCLFYRPPRSSHCAVCNSCIDVNKSQFKKIKKLSIFILDYGSSLSSKFLFFIIFFFIIKYKHKLIKNKKWVSNCIGKRNYKYFFAFLVSLSIHMLSILSMSILLVWLNKNNLSNVPMLTAIILIILITVLIIPIGGLTGFHAVLVSRGRTTNEQVTGKFRTGVNPFDEGIMKNCAKILFTSSPPSYLEFKRNQKKMREYYEAKILLEKYSRSKNGRLIRNTDSNNVVSPQRYKNPNFYANKAETKRVRSQNHHEQNELELKYNNYLNEDYFAQSRKSTNGNRDLINKIKKKEMLQYARNDSYTSASQNLLTNDMVKSRPRDYISKKVIRPNSVDSDDRVNLNSYEITV